MGPAGGENDDAGGGEGIEEGEGAGEVGEKGGGEGIAVGGTIEVDIVHTGGGADYFERGEALPELHLRRRRRRRRCSRSVIPHASDLPDPPPARRRNFCVRGSQRTLGRGIHGELR